MVKRMKAYLETNEIVKHILIISFIYFIAHWFLLILSGYWWDDSVLLFMTKAERDVMYSQSGGVTGSLFTDSIIWMPDGGYRVCVFIEYLLSAWFLYFILRKIDLFTVNDSLWISVLFVIAPVNDARATIICYGYSCTFFLFYLAFWLVTVWQEKQGIKRWAIRVLTWFVLFISYSTQSFIVMTGIILLYLYYFDYKLCMEDSNNVTKFFKAIPKIVVRNIDYILVPILFWIIQSLFFKPWGSAAGKNEVSVRTLAIALIRFPIAILSTLKELLYSCITDINNHYFSLFLILILSVLFVIFILKKKYWKGTEAEIILIDWIQLAIGIAAFCAGLFPYAVVRGGRGVYVAGIGGRDSLCLSLGIAISVYALIKLVFRIYLREYIIIMLVLIGCVHFNNMYFQYQREWYEELEIMNEISSEERILDNNTFYYWFKYSKPCGSGLFYNVNFNSYEATGDQTRFFTNNLHHIVSWVDRLRKYAMKDYDNSDMKLDGIIVFENEPISNMEIMKLKWEELFKKEQFNKSMSEYDRIQFIPLTDTASDKIIEAYQNGEDNPAEYVRIAEAEQ